MRAQKPTALPTTSASTIAQKIVTYDFARQMEGAREVRTSEFATAVIENMTKDA